MHKYISIKHVDYCKTFSEKLSDWQFDVPNFHCYLVFVIMDCNKNWRYHIYDSCLQNCEQNKEKARIYEKPSLTQLRTGVRHADICARRDVSSNNVNSGVSFAKPLGATFERVSQKDISNLSLPQDAERGGIRAATTISRE